MNLEQALAASRSGLACRVVGNLRVIVDCGPQLLLISIQRKAKVHWTTDDNGGGARYLAGLLRDNLGRYLLPCPSDGLFDIEQIRRLLPLGYQTLLLPTSDDWQVVACGQQNPSIATYEEA